MGLESDDGRLPFIGAHPPIEDPHRPVTQTGNDQRTLGVAGKAGHTAVRSCWDVLAHEHMHTRTHTNPLVKVCKGNAHFTLNLL